MTVWTIIGDVLIAVGTVFVIIGIFGLLRFKEVYARVLIAAKVDTIGFITVLTGVMFHLGLSTQTLKLLLILIFTLITSPIVTHAIARSAYSSGIKPFVREDKEID